MSGSSGWRAAAGLGLLIGLVLPGTGSARPPGVPESPGLSLKSTANYHLGTAGPLAPAGDVADCSSAGNEGTAGQAACPRYHDGRREPDRSGLRRDTAYLLSYHVAAIGILYMLPESISNWSDEQKEDYSLSEWLENIRNPQWDDDKHWINYLAHPYWGAAYYVRARERGFDERAAFWYSAAMSTAYEFGAEALFEQPSLQDLVVTPVGGVILGEYFMRIRARTMARHDSDAEMPFADRALLAVTDPLGAINRQVRTWLGRPVNSRFYPYFGPQRLGGRAPYAANQVETDWVYGLQMNYRW